MTVAVQTEQDRERESRLKDISKTLVKSGMPPLQRASLIAKARETMLLEDSIFLHNQDYKEVPKLLVGKLGRNSTEMYQQVVNLLIKDNPEKMKRYDEIQGGNYK